MEAEATPKHREQDQVGVHEARVGEVEVGNRSVPKREERDDEEEKVGEGVREFYMTGVVGRKLGELEICMCARLSARV